jgi:hypothetical protein
MQDNRNSYCRGGLEVVQLVKKLAVKISTYKANFGSVLKVVNATTSVSEDVVGITDQENLKKVLEIIGSLNTSF